jgi:membrane protein YqaA with SNARE-associated domain
MDLARLAPPLAALWGFAEATLFFVVPDVALSFIALRSRRIALGACLWAFAGALAGGVLMYGWGQRDPAAAERALTAVPAVDRAMVARVRGEIERTGSGAIVLGPLRTTPYKIYMVEAGAAGLSPLAAAAASLPSRLGRFLLVTLLVGWAVRGPLRSWSLERQRLAVGAVWVAIYVLLMARGAPLL